ncbi:MAG: addiction module protein [Betaproteobacteria bacterium]|nr:addiction module protein [Betaproteobacteria bacterium]
MTAPVEALAIEVLRLSPQDRAKLLDQVIMSLDADRARDAAWDKVASERDAEIEAGTVEPVSADAVVARLRRELS